MASVVGEVRPASAEVKLLAIGASTGGPTVLQEILAGLKAHFPVPVVIVQHIAPGFVEGLAEWLRPTCALPIHVATHGERLHPGHVYLGQDGFQMRVERDGKVSLTKDPPENGHRPSVSYLFRSVAEVFGENAVGVLLTGMGKDGAEELRLMRAKGAITIAQDKESSVIHGMPGEAIQREAATYVLASGRMAGALAHLVKSGRGTKP
jgi:two-component system chemotaxis response regulator CheB